MQKLDVLFSSIMFLATNFYRSLLIIIQIPINRTRSRRDLLTFEFRGEINSKLSELSDPPMKLMSGIAGHTAS